VIDQLLELRAAMEKIRPLDNKLKYHIDRLLKVLINDAIAAAAAADAPVPVPVK
jgi:hypothetical protein